METDMTTNQHLVRPGLKLCVSDGAIVARRVVRSAPALRKSNKYYLLMG